MALDAGLALQRVQAGHGRPSANILPVKLVRQYVSMPSDAKRSGLRPGQAQVVCVRWATTTVKDLGATQAAGTLCRGVSVPHLLYLVLAVPPSFAGAAVLVATVRAKKKDLPDIVRSLMRLRSRDDKRDDDSDKGQPSLPKP